MILRPPRSTLPATLFPYPTLFRSLHLGGKAGQLVLRQPFQQRGIGQIHAAIGFREQIAAGATACGLVSIQPDEAHQRVPVGVNLALGQAVAQVMRAALPCRRSEEHTSELQSLMRLSYAVFCLTKTQYTLYYTHNA